MIFKMQDAKEVGRTFFESLLGMKKTTYSLHSLGNDPMKSISFKNLRAGLGFSLSKNRIFFCLIVDNATGSLLYGAGMDDSV